MRWNPIFLAAVLSTASVSAQVKLGESPTPSAGSKTAAPAQVIFGESPVVHFASPASNGCPIGIVAERRSPVIISTVGTTPSAPRSQGVKLRFYNLLPSKIEQVTVVVHGLSQKNRIVPTEMGSTSDVEETFQLTSAEQATSLTASFIQPKRVFTTQWVELTSVDYTDGSTWHASRVAQCTVTPNNLVLVATR